MSIKFTDYIKLEGMKSLVTNHLNRLGFKEELKVINDEDLNKIITLMASLGEELREYSTEEKKVDSLISYIISLWVKLIIVYGADVDEM